MSDDQAVATTDEEITGEESGEKKDLATRMKEAIEVDVEDIGALRRRVAITVPRSLLDEQLDEQYGDLSRDSVIPGFRKGRAPRRLIEKRYGREVNDQVRSQILGQGYMAAIEKAEIKAVSDPMIRVAGDADDEKSGMRLVSVREALDKLDIPAEGDLQFECEVEIQPEFELPKLEKIKLKRPKVGIADADIDEQVDRLRSMRGTLEPVEGKIKTDDLAIADVVMKVGKDVIEQQENIQVAARGQNLFGVAIPDLGEALGGKKSGDTVKVESEVPDDHDRTDIRGKKATFEIIIHEVKRIALPPIDKAFLTQIGFENEKGLRDWLRSDLESRLGDALQEGLRNQVYQYLLDGVSIDLPEGLSSRQADRVVARRVLELRQRGVSDTDIEKHIDELRTGAKDEAAAQLKASFILERIAEERDIHVSEEEVNAQIANIAARYNRRFDRVRDDLSKGDGLTSLYVQIRDQKIVDGLIGDAEIIETEGPAKESKSKAPSAKTRTADKKPKDTPAAEKPKAKSAEKAKVKSATKPMDKPKARSGAKTTKKTTVVKKKSKK